MTKALFIACATSFALYLAARQTERGGIANPWTDVFAFAWPLLLVGAVLSLLIRRAKSPRAPDMKCCPDCALNQPADFDNCVRCGHVFL